MQVVYSLTKQDFLEYHKRLARTARTAPTGRIVGWVVSIGVGVIIAALAPLTRGHWAQVALLAGVVALVLRGVALLLTRNTMLTAYLNQPGAQAPCTLVLHDWGLASARAGMSSRVGWDCIAAITDERGYLMFLSHPQINSLQISIFFVPERAFATAAEKTAFLDEARRSWTASQGKTGLGVSAPVSPVDAAARVTASYPMTLGEIAWMRTLAQTRSALVIFLWRPLLATALVFPLYWLLFGSWRSALIAFEMWPIIALLLWRTSRAGPQAKGKSAQPVGAYALTLAPEGVEQKTPLGIGTTPWGLIAKIVDRNKYVVFWGENAPLYLVPAGTFGSAEEMQAFVTTARDYWQSAKDGTSAPPPTRPAAWPPPPMR